MAIDINLVLDNDAKNPQSDRIRKLTAISFAFLFFTAFFSFLIFLLNLRFSVNAIRQDQQELSNSLSTYDQTASKMLILNNQAIDISRILKIRKNYTPSLEKILQIKPAGVSFEAITIEGGNIEITATSTSLFELNEFLNSLLESNSEGVRFSNVNLKNLSATQAGFTLIITSQL